MRFLRAHHIRLLEGTSLLTELVPSLCHWLLCTLCPDTAELPAYVGVLRVRC